MRSKTFHNLTLTYKSAFSILCCFPQLLISLEIPDIKVFSLPKEEIFEKLNVFDIPPPDSNSHMVESHQFLESVIQEINAQYELNIGIEDACRLVKENINQLNVSPEMRQDLLSIADLFESRHFSVPLESDSLPSHEHEAHFKKYHFYPPWKWNFFGLNKQHHSKQAEKSTIKTLGEQEFVLPDKLAAGFVCALAGALLCVVPGGQAVGLTLMGTGLALAIDGMSNGERPYYINRETGEKTPLSTR